MKKLIKKHESFLSFLFLLIAALNIFNFIKTHPGHFNEEFSPDLHRKLYGQSQYILKEPISEIADEIVYALAGWEYVHGLNPILLNGEQPPLGKYFIGLSELWFNNSRFTAPIFNILCLVALFWLLNLLLESRILAAVLTTIFSFEKVFIAQMLYSPNLDNIQLFFVLVAFCFFVKFYKSGKFLIPALLSLGLVAATKFWITAFIILIVWLLSLLLTLDRKKLKPFTSPISLTILMGALLIPLLASYYQSFAQGMSLREFFGTQKYIYSWHSAKLEFNPIAVWDLLLLNRWHNRGEIVKAVDWQLTWPILTILSVVAIYQLMKLYKKEGAKNPLFIIGVWFVVYFALLSVSNVNARYLFPILPAMYVLGGWVIKSKIYGK